MEGITQRQLCKDKSVANVRNVKPSFYLEEIMTRCEFYQNKAELLHNAMVRTKGTMREIWKNI